MDQSDAGNWRGSCRSRVETRSVGSAWSDAQPKEGLLLRAAMADYPRQRGPSLRRATDCWPETGFPPTLRSRVFPQPARLDGAYTVYGSIRLADKLRHHSLCL